MVRRLDPAVEERLAAALETATSYFMGNADVQGAALALASRLDEAGIPYAIAGALALAAHGYLRVTDDADVLLTREGLAELERRFVAAGYERSGSKGLRDAQRNVKIDVLTAGDFPGDGKPKPVAFPDPAQVAERGERFAVLPLERLIELKLASGISAPHRLRDLADVLELVRAGGLPRALGERLDASVRPKFDELWLAAQGADPT
ncbi:MAG: hypothetical protein KF878_23485 [Planctomycetes bacterium]|nr:hypothetical protein [Planctomycetota bacterium]